MEDTPADDSITSGGKVPVISPEGDFGTIDQSELSAALSQGGFKLADQKAIEGYSQQMKYGEGTANSLKAAALGAARGVTFGGSDYLLGHSGLGNLKEMQGLKEQHPWASGLGEAAGVLGASALNPVGALGEVAEGASLLNPVSAASRLGGAITEAATPIASDIAGLIANPETSPLTHRILTQAGSHAVGSSVEAAAYGMGQNVSESALGDPNLNAEKMMSNIGYSALMGGGIGALLGGAVGSLSKVAPTLEKGFISELDQAAVDSGDLKAITETSALPQSQKESVLAGLKELKPDAKEIYEAGDLLGAPVMGGQVSSSKPVQWLNDKLLHSVSYYGQKYQKMAKAGFDAVAEKLNGVLGPAMDITETSVGRKMGESLAEQFETHQSRVDGLFEDINKNFPLIPVEEKATQTLAKDFLAHPDIEGLGRLDSKDPVYKFVDRKLDMLKNAKTASDLKTVATSINSELKEISNPSMKHWGGELIKKIRSLEESSMNEFASKLNPENSSTIKALIDQRKIANSEYTSFMDKANDLAKMLGKKRVYGPKDMVEFLKDVDPQQLTKKIFSDKKVAQSEWFAKNFPEQMEMLRQYKLNSIRAAAHTEKGFNSRSALKAINGMEPETRNLLFDPAQRKMVDAAQKWVGSFPEDFNPSHTSHAIDLMQMINPKYFLGAQARDFAFHKIIEGTTKGEGVMGSAVDSLSKIERTFKGVDTGIEKKAKNLFKFGEKVPFKTEDVSGFLGAKLVKDPSHYTDHAQNHDEMTAKVQELMGNPSKLVEHLEGSTEHLAEIAPQIAQNLQIIAARATQYLSTQIPPKLPRAMLSAQIQPSPSEIEHFKQSLSMVEKPQQILGKINNGSLTQNNVDAVKSVYPKLYEQMKMSVMDNLTKFLSKNDVTSIPYSAKISLSMFLGQDLDYSLSQQSIMSNQIALAGNGQQQAKSQAQGTVRASQKGLSKLNVAESQLTSMQASGSRGVES